jgi:3D (Asp-Asp-Asp) domain-containing protein
MFRVKLLAAVFSIFVALGEEFSLFGKPKSESEIAETKPLDWPPSPETDQPETPSLPEVITVSASVYFPEPNQTDATPFITADGSRINPRSPGKHRWIAVSRDLHSRWGGELEFGDSLWVSGISDDLDGLYIVRDTMNRRIRNQIDILVGRHDKVMGFWNDVHIARLD